MGSDGTSGGAAREAFLDEAARLLAGDPRVGAVERVPDALGLRVMVHGEPRTFLLDAVFTETLDLAPAARAAALLRLLRLDVEAAPAVDWAEAERRLLLALRPSMHGVAEAAAAGGPPPLGWRFVPFVRALAALDAPDGIGLVGAPHLRGWGVGADEVRAAAERNVARLPVIAPEPYDRSRGTIWHLPERDGHEASRLLAPGWLAGFRGKVDGRPIAIVPDRTSVWIAGDARPDAVLLLADMAQRQYRSSPRRISPALYTLSDAGHVVPYRRPGHGEAERAVALGHATLALDEYARQRPLLERRVAADGRDLFVASLEAVARQPGGIPITCAVWTEGVPTLLPAADAVVLVAGDPVAPSWTALVPFDHLARIAGSAWVEEPVPGPPRYRTPPWLGAEQVARARRARSAP
jgi:hypothetical protein